MRCSVFDGALGLGVEMTLTGMVLRDRVGCPE